LRLRQGYLLGASPKAHPDSLSIGLNAKAKLFVLRAISTAASKASAAADYLRSFSETVEEAA
jgi:hypothetical protein